MPRRWPLARLAALAAGLLVVGACRGDWPVSPAARAALDVDDVPGVDPDTGDLVLWPSDSAPPAPAAQGGPMLALGAPVPTIRIGVVQSSATVVLGSLDDYAVKDKATGVVQMSGTNGSVTVALAAVPEAYIYFQVTCNTVAFVSARKATADGLGYYTLTENALKPDGTLNCVRLLIGRLPTSSTTAQRTAFKNTLISQGLAGSDAFARSITIGTQTVYRITRGTLSVQTVNPVVVTSSTGIVTIGASATSLRRYRGKGEARINSLAQLAGIDELSVEDYLYGVVPSELSPVLWPEMEAQKAQAVAARTYALSGLNKRAADGYDLRATTDDQVYDGYAFEKAASSQAVDETRGVVATYEGRLIAANFSSTSGGHTADSEESFSAYVAYQRGVPDAERGEALENVPTLEVFRAHANPTSLRALKEGDFESDWARFHRWTFEWTAEEIAGVLASTLHKPITQVYEINALSRGPSGRVLELEIVSDAGRDVVLRDGIRAVLKYLDANARSQNLPSTLFFVEPVSERGQRTGGFRVYGGGLGHGVGMAQTGAVGMAQKGHTFEEILKFYYQGIALETWY